MSLNAMRSASPSVSLYQSATVYPVMLLLLDGDVITTVN